ncbi:MAG: type IX secretion system outer membrane channel protein PorV [Chitinophagales bacterium]|nr:type IX secretion system outer membrane channel protein PorV [Chitinophagales bacterium]
MKKISVKIFFVCILIAQNTFAQINPSGLNGSNTVFTAIPFLRINPDVRTGGMGEVGIATDPDAGSMFHNASKLAFANSNLSVAATCMPWLCTLVDDSFIANVSGYKKIGDLQTIGLSLRYFSLSKVQFTTISGQYVGTFKPNEFAIDLAYSRRLSDNFGAGVTLKYVRSDLARGQVVGSGNVIKAAQAIAADVSAYYTKNLLIGGRNSRLSLGTAITNIGNKVSYVKSQQPDFIPINLGLGSNLTIAIDDYNKVSFAFDINKLMVPTPDTTDLASSFIDKPLLSGMFGSFGDAPGGFKEEMQELMYSMGAEYWYNNRVAVRLGHFNENKYKGNRKYVTVGAGANFGIFRFNAAYIFPHVKQRNPLDNTWKVSVGIDIK